MPDLHVRFVLTSEHPDGKSDTKMADFPMPTLPRIGECVVHGDGEPFEVEAIDWHLNKNGIHVDVVCYRKDDTGQGE